MNKEEYYNMYKLENNFWWYKTLHSLIISIVKQKKKASTSILDAGCGTGRLVELLNDLGEVTGLDFSEEAIHLSKKRGLKNVFTEDLNTWESKEKYNIITSIDVLYHSAIKEDTLILQKFYKSLSNEGTLILNLPAFNSLKRDHDEVVHTKRRYVKKNLVNKLESIGFTVQKASYRLPHLYIIIILRKFLNKLFLIKKNKSDVQELSKWINNVFVFLGKLENYFLLKIGSLPLGSSLFIVAIKEKK